METMKELIKKDLEKGFKTQKKYYETEQEIKNLYDKQKYFWQDAPKGESINYFEEHKKEYEILDKNIKKLKTKNEVNRNIINIIQNNLKIRVIEILMIEVFPLLKKYAPKNIGEKTREKIENEIQEYFEKNYNLILSFSFYQTESFCKSIEYKINISIAESYTIEKNYYNQSYRMLHNTLGLNGNGSHHFEMTLYKLENAEDVGRYENIEDYKEFENKYYKIIDYINNLRVIEFEYIDAHAKRIQKEREKTIEKIKKLKKELDATCNQFNQTPLTSGFLRHNYIDRTKI